MSAGEWAAIVAVQLCLVLFVVLLVVLVRLERAAAELRATTRALALQTGAVVEELREAVRDADFELDRVDALVRSAERVTGRVDAAAGLADKVITSPVVRAMAVGTGTKRAVQRLAGSDAPAARRRRKAASVAERRKAASGSERGRR
ncbi:MAG: hypothetical protein ACHQIG_00815 [Acidimicrobiia bacterium]